ncbi:MAG: polyhydroxyalkanoate synthesis regulator DNA-binding domain-containing protein [Desulfobacterales bacterium]|nr:polyhydroxyalkanoate synthesis regulator DNA-binding domain-containing protein [Desulfobacterales bacterium]
MHRIKKYANRKLYDTTDKKYVSRKRLSELIRKGEDIVITDNETGEDITASIVSGLIAANSGKSGGKVSSGILIQLFRKGGNAVTDYAKRYVSLWQKSLTLAEDEIDTMVKTLVRNKELTRAEGNRLKKEITGFTTSVKDWISDIIDARLKEVISAANLVSRDQFDDLHARVQTLEEKLAHYEQLHSEEQVPSKTDQPEAPTKEKAPQKT